MTRDSKSFKSRLFFFLMSSMLLFGCKSYVQVFDTTGIGLSIEDKFYVWETDSIKITYSFWEKKGLMTFAIFNKSSIPLYIDWKKSSYIDNSVKLNYWSDEIKSKSSSAFGSYYYRGPLVRPGFALSETSGITSAIISKEERISFIPPKAQDFRAQFYILPVKHYALGVGVDYMDVARNDDTLLVTRVYKKDFTKEKSPILFRNFLTYSYTEDFKVEYYIDNEFFVNRIVEMDKNHFQYVLQKNSKKEFFNLAEKNGFDLVCFPYKMATSFYINIPMDYSIEQMTKSNK
ncbi:MAG: hypothetical protein KA347_06940 [Bacteroidia bacterium]|nr:hypothetical protein [Bacteroidia bacterium]MBP7244345.1 hypothetical protein [Bacteroidia bacterium]